MLEVYNILFPGGLPDMQAGMHLRAVATAVVDAALAAAVNGDGGDNDGGGDNAGRGDNDGGSDNDGGGDNDVEVMVVHWFKLPMDTFFLL